MSEENGFRYDRLPKELQYAGPVTRIVAGTPIDFISQQSGLYDRYLTNLDGDWRTLVEMLPIDSSKFGVSMSEGLVSIKASQMPWYTLGWVEQFDNDMYEAMSHVLNRAVNVMGDACRTEICAEAVDYVFEEETWKREMSRVESEYELLVLDEKVRGLVPSVYALAIESGVRKGPMNVFGPEVQLADDDVNMRIKKPKVEDFRASGTKKVRSAEFDLKLRQLLHWFMAETFGGEPDITTLIETSIKIRLMPVADMKKLISKMAISMVPLWDQYSAARLAIFEECLGSLMSRYSEFVSMGEETTFDLLHSSQLTKALLQKQDNFMPYVGGTYDVKGSGSNAPALLVGGDRSEVTRFNLCLIAPSDSATVPSGLKNLKSSELTLHKNDDEIPFRVGGPIRESGKLLTFTEEDDADVYPFRSNVTGGVINYEPKSLYTPRPAEKMIHIPKTSNQPRYAFSMAGFAEAITAGNISVLGGSSCLMAGQMHLNRDGIWER